MTSGFFDPAAIAPPLLSWYHRHRRDLPWRRTSDPYAIWVSEVMLQQTRVQTVIPYYERFLSRYPDPATLAAADPDEVLEHWAGLGYYSRGRNLQRAAQQLVREHAGRFPRTRDGLRTLPGVGDYTAVAVASIAFGDPVAVIDGNVERVLTRLLAVPGDPRKGTTRKQLRSLAASILDTDHPGDHNQAMMELGATVCTPRSPDCARCPLGSLCLARQRDQQLRFPELPARRASEDQQWIAVLPRSANRQYWLTRLSAEAELLPGHWGFPLARVADPDAASSLATARRLLRATTGSRARKGWLAPPIRHAITHRRLRVVPVVFTLRTAPSEPHRRAAAERLPALFRKLLEVAESATPRS